MGRPRGSKNKKTVKPKVTVSKYHYEYIGQNRQTMSLAQLMAHTNLSRSTVKRIIRATNKTKRQGETALGMPPLTQDELAERVKKIGGRMKNEGGCWVVAKNEMLVKGKWYQISRVLYGFHKGVSMEGTHLYRKCHNSKCINPDHFWAAKT